MTPLDSLSALLGIWKGFGKGSFPTIDPFNYSETFSVRRRGEGAYLIYEQSTALVDEEGNILRSSHWETGVIRILGDESVEIVCVHGSGRIEVLRGHFTSHVAASGAFSIEFQSELVANDDHVRNSKRDWTLQNEKFSYRMWMATSEVTRLTLHLQASLDKGRAAG